MNTALQLMGEAIYRTHLKKGDLIELIAEMNGVSVRTVQNWMIKGGEIEAGRIIASLNDIIQQEARDQ